MIVPFGHHAASDLLDLDLILAVGSPPDVVSASEDPLTAFSRAYCEAGVPDVMAFWAKKTVDRPQLGFSCLNRFLIEASLIMFDVKR